MYVEYIRTSSLNQKMCKFNMFDHVYHWCMFLIFDQTAMAQEQKYLRNGFFVVFLLLVPVQCFDKTFLGLIFPSVT